MINYFNEDLEKTLKNVQQVSKLLDNLQPVIRDNVKKILLDKGLEIYTMLVKELPLPVQDQIIKIMQLDNTKND